MQTERQYSRRKTTGQPLISKEPYRVGLSVNFLLYALILFGVVVVFDVPTVLIRDDFGGIAQVAASVSAICLALFPFVQAGGSTNRYLKLTLAVLSLNFVLATLFSVLVIATTELYGSGIFRQTLTVWVFIGILVVLGVTELASLRVKNLKQSLQRRLWDVSWLSALENKLSRVEAIADYSGIALPFVIILLWIYPLNLASATLLLMISGLTCLVAFSVVFAFQAARERTTDDERLRDIILQTLHHIHSARVKSPASEKSYELISVEEILEALDKTRILRNRQTVRDLLDQMLDDDVLFGDYRGYYVFPSSQDFDSLPSLLRPVALLLTGCPDNSVRSPDDSVISIVYNGIESNYLSMYLSKGTRYPLEVVERFFLPIAFAELESSFDYSLPSRRCDQQSSGGREFTLYAKSPKILSFYRKYNDRKNRNEKQLVVVTYPQLDSDMYSYGFLPMLQASLTTVPYDLEGPLKIRQCCMVLFLGLGEILGANIEFVE